MNLTFFSSTLATLSLWLGLIGLAQATTLEFRPSSVGVEVTMLDVDAPGGLPPARALHCMAGTRRGWVSRDGGTTWSIGQMIGGCGYPDSRGSITHVIPRSAVQDNGVLCLIPLWLDQSGRLLAYSSHADGPTNHRSRRGGMITALVLLADGQWRPATAVEAYTCD